MRLATVLYEDKMQVGANGAFPPHDFLLSLIGDRTGETVWSLRRLIDKNPRKGIGNVIKDLSRTRRIAGAGLLCIVVDRDRTAEHLGLPRHTDDAEVTSALLERSDAPERLRVHYLDPNMEGLLASIAACGSPTPPPGRKSLNDRDVYLNRAAFGPRPIRDCVRRHQQSLAELADLLAERLPTS